MLTLWVRSLGAAKHPKASVSDDPSNLHHLCLMTGIETLYFIVLRKSSRFCLLFHCIFISLILQTSTCLLFWGLVSVAQISPLIMCKNPALLCHPEGLSWMLFIPNPALNVFYLISADFRFYKQDPDGHSCCTDNFSLGWYRAIISTGILCCMIFFFLCCKVAFH